MCFDFRFADAGIRAYIFIHTPVITLICNTDNYYENFKYYFKILLFPDLESSAGHPDYLDDFSSPTTGIRSGYERGKQG